MLRNHITKYFYNKKLYRLIGGTYIKCSICNANVYADTVSHASICNTCKSKEPKEINFIHSIRMTGGTSEIILNTIGVMNDGDTIVSVDGNIQYKFYDNKKTFKNIKYSANGSNCVVYNITPKLGGMYLILKLNYNNIHSYIRKYNEERKILPTNIPMILYNGVIFINSIKNCDEKIWEYYKEIFIRINLFTLKIC